MNTSCRDVARFLLPWAIGLVGLTLIPMLASLVLSFARLEGGLSSDHISWVGTRHYEQALEVESDYEPSDLDPWYWRYLGGKPGDARFYTSLYNSLVYTLIAVPLGLCTSFVVALLLHRPLRGMSVVRACVYLPHVLGGVATIVIWSWLFNPQFGWFNQVIRLVYHGLDPLVRMFHEDGTTDWPTPRWLYSPMWCKPAVIIMHVWTMGGSMLIFLAALRRVPSQLYAAASLDGAGSWRRFRHVTLPQSSPAILFNLTVSLIFAMQSFSEAYVLQNRAQDDGLLFYVLNIYQAAFEPPYRLGYASALAWILFVVLFVLAVPLMLTARRWVYYAGEE